MALNDFAPSPAERVTDLLQTPVLQGVVSGELARPVPVIETVDAPVSQAPERVGEPWTKAPLVWLVNVSAGESASRVQELVAVAEFPAASVLVTLKSLPPLPAVKVSSCE